MKEWRVFSGYKRKLRCHDILHSIATAFVFRDPVLSRLGLDVPTLCNRHMGHLLMFLASAGLERDDGISRS